MSDRLAAGFTIAGFPLTASLLAITAGNFILAAVLGLAFVLAAVLTIAPRLPHLHKLPLVGAPRLTAGFKANGSVELHGPQERPQVTLAAPADQFPLSILVQVGITNHSDQDVTHALVNVGAPVGQSLAICDGWGRPRDLGQPMLPTHAGYDYWSIKDWRFTGRDGHLLYFRLSVREPGTYPIFATISSRSLYEELTEWAEIRVVEQEWEALELRDQIGALIDKGELIGGQMAAVYTGDRLRTIYAAWYLEALNAMPEGDPLWQSLEEAKANWPGPKSGNDFYVAESTAKLKRLYEIRDLLGSKPYDGG